MTGPDPAAELRRAARALDRAAAALDAASKPPSNAPVKPRSTAPSKPPVAPITEAEHRRQHRPGRPARLDADAELRAFVLDRIETMTFDALAGDIAAAFPEDRRVGASTLHRFWQRIGGDAACGSAARTEP
jgi:hypothetical protein